MKKSKVFSLLLVVLMMACIVGIPESRALAAETGEAVNVYTVQGGDSLCKIAQTNLGDAARWSEIFDLNRGQITDPNLIFKGQNLLLPETSGVTTGTAPLSETDAAAPSQADTASSIQPDAAYLAQADRLAEEIYSKAASREPAVTNIMKSCESDDAHLAGLDFRLKTKDSIARKLVTNAKDMEVTLDEAVPTIRDALRYTLVIEDKKYAEVTQRTLNTLLANGYALTKFKNTWGDDGYKGINVFLRTPDGVTFELQFHTPLSYDTKEKNHDLYETARSDYASEADKKEANQKMTKIYNAMPIPPDAVKVDYTAMVVK